ncbi:MAG: transposase [archaeon]
MKQEQIMMRKEKGLHIAKTSRIQRNDKGEWKVPSQTGSGYYIVVSKGLETKCNCPDHELRHCKCKHIWAVEYIVTQEVDNQGNITQTTTIRKTYKQDWKAYNYSKQIEKDKFMELLADITSRIREPVYDYGRPTNPLSDSVFAMVFKVYSTYSGRRFASDMNLALERKQIEKRIPYNSMFDYFQKKEMTPLLSQIVQITSLPLSSVEKDFSVDSTGFGTANFQRWFSFKHGKEITSRKWVKCHFMNGNKTNIISAVKITTEFDNDCPELKELVNTTAENFDMEEVACDKAYLSRENMEIIASYDATPYIPFKSNSTARAGGSAMWHKMYYYFKLNQDEFLEHYHKRSNGETTVHMIKSKFGDRVRSKKWVAQVNEVLCKIIAHNICCVIQEMHELKVEAKFEI